MAVNPLVVFEAVASGVGLFMDIYGIVQDIATADTAEDFFNPDAEMQREFEQVNESLDALSADIAGLDAKIDDFGSDVSRAFVAITNNDMTAEVETVFSQLNQVDQFQSETNPLLKDLKAWDMTKDANDAFGRLMGIAENVVNGGNVTEIGLAIAKVTAAASALVQTANAVTDAGYRTDTVSNNLERAATLLHKAKEEALDAMTDGASYAASFDFASATFNLEVRVDSPLTGTLPFVQDALVELGLIEKGAASNNGFEMAPQITIANDLLPDQGWVEDILHRPTDPNDVWTINTRDPIAQSVIIRAINELLPEIELAVGEGIARAFGIDLDAVTSTADAMVAMAAGDEVKGTAHDDDRQGTNADDFLYGLGGDDSLDGQNGSDMLRGDTGDDVLNGGRGADILEGGEGADIFVFDNRDGVDVIRDFEPGTDKIALDKSAFDGMFGWSFNSFEFADGFADQSWWATQIIQEGNELYYDADGTGGRDAELIAELSNGAQLSSQDFVLC